ncbi:hypothetical protein GGF37_003611 [Kickxella alabastrina]|nr:hypothetical protein GGF37_003611 [Kickxella alabastrina]
MPAMIQQQQQQQQLVQSQTQVQPQEPPSSSTSVSSFWSLWTPRNFLTRLLFGWNEMQEINRKQTVDIPRDGLDKGNPNPYALMLVEMIPAMKVVAKDFLAGLEIQLKKANSKDIADIIRGPMADTKQFLKSIWPTLPSGGEKAQLLS